MAELNVKSKDQFIPENLELWLKKAPSLTTYRINLLKTNIEILQNAFEKFFNEQALSYKRTNPPIVKRIFNDALGIECWLNVDLDKTERSEVIVDAACGAAVLRGSHVFAPGVMGLPSDVSLHDEVNIYADLSGHCRRGLKMKYIDGIKRFVGLGRLKQTRHDIFGENSKPAGIAVETIMPASSVPVIDVNILPPGSCLLQNLPSIICSKVLDPQKGELILDMCAAPGNKTSHIAEIINNQGIIIALDKTEVKINQIKKRCFDFSITCVHPFVFNGTKAVQENLQNDNQDIMKGPPFYPETFDRILLDTPCSALGQRPMLKTLPSPKVLNSYIPLQRKLFHAAVRLLKKSGILVYSTCTITQGECESMVAWALKMFPNLVLIPAEPLLGGPGWKTSELTENQRSMLQRFGPEKDELRIVDPMYNDTIGFFIARFQKN